MIYDINNQAIESTLNIDKLGVDTLYNYQKEIVKEKEDGGFDWSKIKWIPIGDSLSSLTGNGTAERPSNHKYQLILGEEIPQMNIVNYLGSTLTSGKRFANGGCGYWAGGSNNFASLADYVPEDANLITIFGSVNDWQYRTLISEGCPYKNPLCKFNSRSNADQNGAVSWVKNPHLDTIEDKTLAGYINQAFRRIHERCPHAKVVVISGLSYYGVGTTYVKNVYFLYEACVKAWQEFNNADWLFFETWDYAPTITSSIDNNGDVTYSVANTSNFIDDQLQIDKWFEHNLNQNFSPTKFLTDLEFCNEYLWDYKEGGQKWGHPNNAYYERYLSVKFAHTIINNMGGAETDLPTILRYNNL